MKNNNFKILIIRPSTPGRKHRAIHERRQNLFPLAVCDDEYPQVWIPTLDLRNRSEFMDDLIEGRLEEKKEALIMWEFELKNDEVKIIIEVIYADTAGDVDFELFVSLPSGQRLQLDLDFYSLAYKEFREVIRNEVFKNLPEEIHDRDGN
jgi:hypothetical protein